VWAGFNGAPGYSNFHFADIGTDAGRNAAGAAVHSFFQTLMPHLRISWTVSVLGEVTEYDMATGDLLGAAAMTTVPAFVTGSDTSNSWAGGSGYSVQWNTGLIHTGRRLRGRTYIVPAANVFEADGTMSLTAINLAGTAAAALIGAVGAEFSIWKRIFTKPTLDMTGAEIKAFKQVQVGGALAPVTGYNVKDSAAQLRTRRT